MLASKRTDAHLTRATAVRLSVNLDSLLARLNSARRIVAFEEIQPDDMNDDFDFSLIYKNEWHIACSKLSSIDSKERERITGKLREQLHF